MPGLNGRITKLEAVLKPAPPKVGDLFTARQLEVWRDAVTFGYRAVEWYGSCEAAEEAIERGEELSPAPAWGFGGEFPEVGAITPILARYFTQALMTFIDVAVREEVPQDELESAEWLAACLEFCRDALEDPPDTAQETIHCLDGTVSTVTYYADGRKTWLTILPDGTRKERETRWRWE